MESEVNTLTYILSPNLTLMDNQDHLELKDHQVGEKASKAIESIPATNLNYKSGAPTH